MVINLPGACLRGLKDVDAGRGIRLADPRRSLGSQFRELCEVIEPEAPHASH